MTHCVVTQDGSRLDIKKRPMKHRVGAQMNNFICDGTVMLTIYVHVFFSIERLQKYIWTHNNYFSTNVVVISTFRSNFCIFTIENQICPI